MSIGKQFQNILTIFGNGLAINFNQSISKDFLNSFIFCSTFIIIFLGLPTDALPFNGIASWVFRTIYPQYLEMDLSRQFNFEPLVWSQIKISLFISLSIFLLTVTWIAIFFNANRKAPLSDYAILLFLFIFRWVFAIQFVGMSFIPILIIKIFDVSYYLTGQMGIQIKQLPFWEMKNEIVCLGVITGFFLLNFLYQAKKLLDLVQALPRKWLTLIMQKFTFPAIIPILLGLTISSYFHSIMKTDNVLNKDIFSYNKCIYMKQNPNIPGYNAIKALVQEVGCKKYTTCFIMTDERLRNKCLSSLYAKSENFKFLVENENREICRS